MTRRLPESLKVLRARRAFLESRVNSRFDPFLQKLIADTDAEIGAREAFVHYQRLVNLGQWRCCDECHKPEHSGPMLHNELWASIAKPDDLLCFACTEKRLGRRLTQGDLTDCPFNAGWIPFNSADVAAMHFAPGPHLLPVQQESAPWPAKIEPASWPPN